MDILFFGVLFNVMINLLINWVQFDWSLGPKSHCVFCFFNLKFGLFVFAGCRVVVEN